MSSPRALVHTSRQEIRWGDMDALGHVNNTVYFRYMEQARIEWLHAVGTLGPCSDPATASVVVNASCTFLVPLVYPGALEVRLYAGARGRSSVATTYEIVCAGQVAAEGAAKMVWIDLASGRSTPLPRLVVASLESAGLR
jgi:acyl-CoA thioester hydrolase